MTQEEYQQIIDLAYQSLSLNFTQKRELKSLFPKLKEDQVLDIKQVFLDEQKERIEIFKRLFAIDPDLSKKLHQVQQKAQKNMMKKYEEFERENESPEEVLRQMGDK